MAIVYQFPVRTGHQDLPCPRIPFAELRDLCVQLARFFGQSPDSVRDSLPGNPPLASAVAEVLRT